MPTVTLRDLEKACRRALAACRGDAALALPLLLAGGVGCSSSDGGAVTVPPQPTSSVAAGGGPTAVATSSPKEVCKVSKPDVTGCGGAEVKLEGSLEACALPETGDLPKARCDELCAGFPTAGCHMFKNREGKPGVYCNAAHPCMGRQPARLVRGTGRRAWRDPVAAHLAFAMRMEAASVHAFVELERDLARFGAPRALLAACRRAAADEARHAEAMRALLARRTGSAAGASASRARPKARGFATLRALALHNEREGVVGEAVGATLAAYQAEHATDPALRAAMKRVAKEELQHAALSLRVAAWARERLGARETRALDAARERAATRALATRAPFGTDAENTLGWPSSEHTARIVRTVGAALGVAA